MSTQPAGYQTPVTAWDISRIPVPSDFNRIEQNVNAIEDGDRTVDPSVVGTGNTASLRTLLDWIVNAIKRVAGVSTWYGAPDIVRTADLTSLSASLSASLAAKAAKAPGLSLDSLGLGFVGASWIPPVGWYMVAANYADSAVVQINVSGWHGNDPVGGLIYSDGSNVRIYANAACTLYIGQLSV